MKLFVTPELAQAVINNEHDWRAIQSMVASRNAEAAAFVSAAKLQELGLKLDELKLRYRNDSNIQKILTEIESVLQ